VTKTANKDSDLVPIDEVARRFGIRASTIRYYEERGLIEPVSRHSGRRWYGQRELRRLAIIRYWQESGLMRLDDIGEILAGPDRIGRWHELIEKQLESLQSRIERMETAREFLEHVAYHHDAAPDGCPHYETLIWGRYQVSSDKAEGGSDHGKPVSVV
jgi:MerR family transcriptional regulator, copper efflux regulator